MFQIRSFQLATCCAALLVSLPAHAETLTQTVASAINHFPEIQSAQHRQEAVRAQAGQARAEFFPSVNTSLGLGRERSRNISTRAVGDDVTLPRREGEITLSQLLFDGGVASGQVRRFNALAEGAGFTVFDTAETVGLRAGQAYAEVRRLREQLGIARENVTVHQRTLSDVTQIADAGRGRRADVVQAEARQALAISSAEQIAGQLAQTEAAYKHLVGRPPGTLEPIPPLAARMPPRLEEAVSAALARHPAALAAEKELQAAQHDQDSARARMTTPRVTVEAGSSRNRDIDGIAGPNQDSFAMLRLRYNLFRGFGDSERVRETAARVDQAVSEVARARNEVERDVRQAWETLVSDRARLPQLENYARASSDVAEAYRLQFQLGQRSLLDVLNAENERFNAVAGAIAGRASVAFGELRLLASMGQLLEALGVSLPEDLSERRRERTPENAIEDMRVVAPPVVRRVEAEREVTISNAAAEKARAAVRISPTYVLDSDMDNVAVMRPSAGDDPRSASTPSPALLLTMSPRLSSSHASLPMSAITTYSTVPQARIKGPVAPEAAARADAAGAGGSP